MLILELFFIFAGLWFVVNVVVIVIPVIVIESEKNTIPMTLLQDTPVPT